MRRRYVVRTPENVEFELELAGPASRGLALAIDVAVVMALLVVGAQLGVLFALVAGEFSFALSVLYSFIVLWGYGAVCEWRFRGQTFGKKICGLRVVQETGLSITFVQAVVRNLVRVVDLLPALYLIGGVAAVLDRYGRRFGDFAAGTLVVRERRAPRPSAIVPTTERHNSFMGDPLVAHAVRRITPPEREAMIGLGLRREHLPLALRHELFGRMREHVERRLGLSRPPFFSDERFVLNLTAVLLERSSRTAPSGTQASIQR